MSSHVVSTSLLSGKNCMRRGTGESMKIFTVCIFVWFIAGPACCLRQISVGMYQNLIFFIIYVNIHFYKNIFTVVT